MVKYMYNLNENFDLDVCYECNNNCLMCTTVRPGYLKKDLGWTRKLIDLKKTIDGCNPNLRTFCFTGGEPTVRPDIIELVQYVLQKLPVTTVNLITNGRMLAYRDFTDKLISIGLKNYILPIHAHASGLHDFITQADGSFEQTKKGILNLLEYDTDLEIRIVIHALNYVYLKETVQFIVDTFGKNIRIVFLYFDITGTASLNRNRLVVNQTKVVPYLENAVDFLVRESINIRIYHFPLCILKPSYRRFAAWRTVSDKRLAIPKQCRDCSSIDDCSGIWKTYAQLKGTKEFQAIK